MKGGVSNIETPPGALWHAATNLREIVGVVADQVRQNCPVDLLQALAVAVTDFDVTILAIVGVQRLFALNHPLFVLLVAEGVGVDQMAYTGNQAHDLNQVRLEDQPFDPKNSLFFAHISAPP